MQGCGTGEAGRGLAGPQRPLQGPFRGPEGAELSIHAPPARGRRLTRGLATAARIDRACIVLWLLGGVLGWQGVSNSGLGGVGGRQEGVGRMRSIG